MEQSTAFGGIQLISLLVFLIIAIIFLTFQQSTLNAVLRENRSMSPGFVWLQLIPLVGQVWQFFVVVNISNSLRNEFSAWQDSSILGLPNSDAVEDLHKRPTFGIGIAYCILNVTTITINLFSHAEQLLIIAALCSLSSITCWIIYWVKLAACRRKLRRRHGFGI